MLNIEKHNEHNYLCGTTKLNHQILYTSFTVAVYSPEAPEITICNQISLGYRQLVLTEVCRGGVVRKRMPFSFGFSRRISGSLQTVFGEIKIVKR
jgi:hypothetical protein